VRLVSPRDRMAFLGRVHLCVLCAAVGAVLLFPSIALAVDFQVQQYRGGFTVWSWGEDQQADITVRASDSTASLGIDASAFPIVVVPERISQTPWSYGFGSPGHAQYWVHVLANDGFSDSLVTGLSNPAYPGWGSVAATQTVVVTQTVTVTQTVNATHTVNVTQTVPLYSLAGTLSASLGASETASQADTRLALLVAAGVCTFGACAVVALKVGGR